MTTHPSPAARIYAGATLAAVLLFAQSVPATAKTTPKTIRRIDHLLVTCGVQVKAHGTGAGANEVIKVRIQEQVANGIDISREVTADGKGNFIMNDFCDPKDPHAEVPALWSFLGTSSGRKGKALVKYRLSTSASTPVTTT